MLSFLYPAFLGGIFYYFLFVLSGEFFDLIFSFASITSCREDFMVYEFDGTTNTSVFGSLLIITIVFYESSIEICRDACIEGIIRTTENVGIV